MILGFVLCDLFLSVASTLPVIAALFCRYFFFKLEQFISILGHSYAMVKLRNEHLQLQKTLPAANEKLIARSFRSIWFVQVRRSGHFTRHLHIKRLSCVNCFIDLLCNHQLSLLLYFTTLCELPRIACLLLLTAL